MRLRPLPLPLAAVLALAATRPALAAPIDLVHTFNVPGTTSDGLVRLVPPVLEDGTPHDLMGGFGSAIAYTGKGNLYIATPDRGPANGTTSYLDRAYVLDLPLPPAQPRTPVSAFLLVNEAGQGFTGNASAFDANNSPSSHRLDPEGIRVGKHGNFYVSDEYGPFVYEFDRDGRRTRVFDVPAKFLIAHPNADGTLELPPGNTSGRQSNRGMEGLALSPDGRKLFGIMQNSLIQDGALNAMNQRRGIYNRILEIDIASGVTREFVFTLDDRSYGVNELVAVNDHVFLAIERDGNAGAAAAFKKIVKVDLAQATDVSNIASLPQTGALPPGVVAATKAPFLDLLDPAFGLAGAGFPEKIEGLAFGPDLPNLRHLLLVTSDNDFVPANSTKIWAFSIDPALLPGFQQ